MRAERRWAAVYGVAALLSVGGAGCSHSIPVDGAPSRDSVITFEVNEGRLTCCALLDLGAAGHLGVGHVDYRDGRSRAWVARMGPAGERQWDHELTLPVEHSALTAGMVTATGDTYAVGWAVETTRDRQRLLAIKVEPDGHPAWMRTSALRLDTKAEGAIVTRDGSLVVAGFTRESGVTGSVFLAGLDRAGKMSWQWPVTDAHEPPRLSLLESARGGFLVGGIFGIVHMETGGRPRWRYDAINVLSAAEGSDGEVFVVGGRRDASARRTELHKLNGHGALVWKHALRDICWVAGSWPSPRGGVIVAGHPCETVGALWLTEISAEGHAMGVTALRLPADAQAYRAAATRDGHVIAAGGFIQATSDGRDHPDGLKGWLLKTARPVRYTK